MVLVGSFGSTLSLAQCSAVASSAVVVNALCASAHVWAVSRLRPVQYADGIGLPRPINWTIARSEGAMEHTHTITVVIRRCSRESH